MLEAPVGDDPLFGSVGAESLKDLVARLEEARDDDKGRRGDRAAPLGLDG